MPAPPQVVAPSPYHQLATWTIASDVAEATCVATVSEHILVGGLLNSGNAGIACYATDGTLCGTFTTTDLPLSLAVAPSEMFGDAVLLVGMRNVIDIYSLDSATWGNRSKRYVTLSEKSLVSAIAVGDDNVFVGDSGAGRGVIAVYNCDGECLGEWGRRPAFSFVFYAVRRLSLAVSHATGLLYAGNPGRHRVEAWSQDGHLEEPLGFGEASTDIDGFCGCCNPIDIAVLASGELVTAEKSLWRVKVLSPSGKLRAVVMDATLRNSLSPPPRSEAASRIGGATLRLAVLPAMLPASEESCEKIVILDEEWLQVYIFAATAL